VSTYDPAAHALAFHTWLQNPSEELETQVRELAEMPEAGFQAVLRADPRIVSVAATRKLLALAYDARLRTSPRGVWLAKLAVRIARDTWEGESQVDTAIEVEGDAWREYAACLLGTGNFPLARIAAQRARELYALTSAEHNAAVLSLYEGRILHELRQSERGLVLVEQGTNLLRELFRDEKRYVQGRTIQASILMELNRFEEAARVLYSVVQPARAMGDTETYAQITYFIGRCMAKLGQTEAAKTVLHEAAKLFHDLDMLAEAPRVRGTLAQMLVEEGRYNEAISEFYLARAEYLRLGLPVIAALVSLDIVDLLVILNRTSEVEHLCNDMIRVFTSAKLPHNALQALAHLQSLSIRTAVSAEDVQHVRTYLELLPSDPDRPFAVT
jgi:tetratricopeptide (TPR) repeat protein